MQRTTDPAPIAAAVPPPLTVTPADADAPATTAHIVDRYRTLLDEADLRPLRLNVAMIRAMGAFDAMTNDFLAQWGLNRSRYSVLRALYFARGRMLRMSDLGREVNVTLKNVARLVGALEDAGWAVRSESASDRRVIEVQLTPAGVALVEELIPAIVAKSKRRWDQFSPAELDALEGLLLKLRSLIDADKGQPAAE